MCVGLQVVQTTALFVPLTTTAAPPLQSGQMVIALVVMVKLAVVIMPLRFLCRIAGGATTNTRLRTRRAT